MKLSRFSIDKTKSPSPYGYGSDFFIESWSVISHEVTNFVSEFFNTGTLLRQLNSTSISLIPKVYVAKYVRWFRPISC